MDCQQSLPPSPPKESTRNRNRLRQANEIELRGIPAIIPCDSCVRMNRIRIMHPNGRSRNCASCTRRGRRCERQFHSKKEWNELEKAH